MGKEGAKRRERRQRAAKMLEGEGEAGRMDVYAYTLAGFYLVLAGIALVSGGWERFLLFLVSF